MGGNAVKADIVMEAKTGHRLDACDGVARGDMIDALVADPNPQRSSGELGRADALQRFDARVNARRLIEFVRSRC